MNIDLTIVFENKIITLNIDKPITSEYLILVLKRKKKLQMNRSYFLLDFYTGENINLIIESAKLMLLPQIQTMTNTIKQIPIEELIQKATKADKPLVIEHKDNGNDCQFSLIDTIEEREDSIDITIDRNQLKSIIQRLDELSIEESPATLPLDINNYSNESNNDIQYFELTLMESITNYVYNVINSNEKFVSIIIINSDI